MKGIHVQTYKSTIVNKILNMNDAKKQIKNLRMNIQEKYTNSKILSQSDTVT